MLIFTAFRAKTGVGSRAKNREIKCSYNCKHEFAAMLQLRETLELIEKNYGDEYERTGYFAAVNKGTLFAFAIDGKDNGSFTL